MAHNLYAGLISLTSALESQMVKINAALESLDSRLSELERKRPPSR